MDEQQSHSHIPAYQMSRIEFFEKRLKTQLLYTIVLKHLNKTGFFDKGMFGEFVYKNACKPLVHRMRFEPITDGGSQMPISISTYVAKETGILINPKKAIAETAEYWIGRHDQVFRDAFNPKDKSFLNYFPLVNGAKDCIYENFHVADLTKPEAIHVISRELVIEIIAAYYRNPTR